MLDITLVSDGRTGKDFADRLEKSERPCASTSQHFARHEFTATSGVEYQVKILKVSDLPEGARNHWGVLTEALGRAWYPVPREVAALLEEKITDGEIKDAGLIGIHVMLKEPYFDCSFGMNEPYASWDLRIDPEGEYRLGPVYARFGRHGTRNLHPDLGVAFIVRE